MIGKIAVLGIEPTTCGSESERATHYITAPPILFAVHKLSLLFEVLNRHIGYLVGAKLVLYSFST